MDQEVHMTHTALVEARRPALRYAQTVTGPVRQDKLGVVLPHEHILLDLRTYHEPFYPQLSDRPVELGMLGRLRRHPTTCLDNLILDDPELMADELAAFKQAGGMTLVDLTCRGPQSDRAAATSAIAAIAQRTGLQMISATGIFSPRFYAEELAGKAAEDLAKEFVHDIEEGPAHQAGLIGKLEIDDPDDKLQARVLKAAASASRRTGAPIAIACPVGQTFERVHSHLQDGGVSPAKVLLCGMDRDMPRETRARPAELGYYLMFDGFGKEWYLRGGECRIPRDPERLRALKELVDAGYLRQLLISQGIDRKMLLARYGGWGYAHILRNVIPMMTRERFAPKQITTITMYNPARVLAFIEQPAPTREQA